MRAILILLIFLVQPYSFAQPLSGVTMDTWPPFMYQNKNTLSGITVDSVKLIFKQADVATTIRALPWARAYNQALKDKNSYIFPLFKTSKRASSFHWVGPIPPAYNMQFYQLKSRTDIKVDSLSDAKKYRVGVLNKVANHKFLLEQGFVEGKNLFIVTEPGQNIKKLFAERIDLLINNPYTLSIQLPKLKHTLSDLQAGIPLYKSEPVFIGLNKNISAETASKLQDAYLHLKQQGQFKAIQQTYLNKNSAPFNCGAEHSVAAENKDSSCKSAVK